jgi:NAD(P)-dependent dehydrogenase (short-subunit alcohol dehydrogenase family)
MKIALITGVSSGIGLATALEMGDLGYHVVAAGRSEERTRATVDDIVAGGGSAEFLHLDLASLDSCREAARQFVESSRELDVLINNAGVGGVRGLTEEGFEIAFGVNHLGHFMLTHHLRPSFRPRTRVVVVSSEVHRRADGIDFDRVRKKTGPLGGWSEYGVSKLANVIFARWLAKLEPDLRCYSLHPGVADTNIFPTIAKPFFRNRKPAHEAARTSLWCATSEEVAEHSGLYYSDMRTREPSAAALDDELANELWRRSEEWCGVSSDDPS